ncbi:MAG TPA: universal stress protein [Acidimicrobiales bacterium]
MFEIVMVGADDSETAKRAVEVATDIAAMYGATLHIVTAFEKGARKGDVAPEFTHVHTEDDGLALLQTLSFIAKKQNIEPALHSVRGDAAAALLGKAKEINADLIVVGNRGMRGLHRVVGSVPNSVSHGAHCSVLVVDTIDG